MSVAVREPQTALSATSPSSLIGQEAERWASIFRTAAELLESGRIAGRAAPIAVAYLTRDELEEWAVLIVDDVEGPPGRWPNCPRRVDHEHALGRVTSVRAREAAFRLLPQLTPDAVHQQRLWEDLTTACREAYEQHAAPWPAAAGVVRVLVKHFAPGANGCQQAEGETT